MSFKATTSMTAEMIHPAKSSAVPSTRGTPAYYLNRLFNLLKVGQVNRYIFVQLEIENLPAIPRSYEIVELCAGDHRLVPFAKADPVQSWRFGQGCICVGAIMGGELVGVAWLALAQFKEDEVRATYVLAPDSAWDLGLEVGDEYRRTRAVLAVLGGLRQAMQARNIRRTVSRIADANVASLGLHEKLKAKRIGSAFFVRFGRMQICFSGLLRAPHISFSADQQPQFRFFSE
jgi:hypothetical protein